MSEGALPDLDEATIRQYTSTESFRRGQNYYEHGAVLGVIRRDRELDARVRGSDFEPYQVRITLSDSGIAQAFCSCPYDWGGWCKHIVATLLTCVHRPGQVEERPPLVTLLGELDREQLQGLVLRLAEQYPRLLDSIEAQVQRLQSGPSHSISPGIASSGTREVQHQTEADPAQVRREVRAILHSLDRMRPSEAYRHVGGVVNEVGHVLDRARDFVEAGDGRNALTILEAITEEYLAGWENLDDSDGEASGFFAGLGPVWTEALLTTDLTSAERKTWAGKLARWAGELGAYGIDDIFDAAQSAALHGWDYPPLRRVLQGEVTEQGAWEGESPWHGDDLAVARLNVLQRQGRHQEYLYLAEAEGQTERYVTMLVRLGRVQEAVDYGLHCLDTTEEALTLARALYERREFPAAMRVAKHGLGLHGPKALLASWLSDLAAGIGETGQALEAARIAFGDNPSLSAYVRVKDLAGERWSEIQKELLALLAETAEVSNAVDIYLSEGRVDEAVRAVDAAGYPGHNTLERVADAAVESHPDWVIRQARAQAESIMSRGKSQRYYDAVRWLEKAWAGYRAAGREAEWRTYVDGLIALHRRKYSLVPMLEALKRSG